MRLHRKALLLAVILSFLSGCIYNSEVNFTRQVLTDLVKARTSVQNAIDWPVFQAVGQDVGAQYAKLATEEARQSFRKSFITNFALGFQAAKGRLSGFRHWRICSQDAQKVIVCADYQFNKQKILFTISKTGKRKLTSIQWEGDEAK